jgi:acetone carboxylase gamma subunit
MPLLQRGAVCPACGRRHDLCLDSNLVHSEPEWEYRYKCPETGATTAVRAGSPWEAVGHFPPGAVPLATG